MGTLSKAFGVNGGYAVGDEIRRRSTSPPSPLEAAAALRGVDVLDSPVGTHLRAVTAQFKSGLVKLDLERWSGEHPVATTRHGAYFGAGDAPAERVESCDWAQLSGGAERRRGNSFPDQRGPHPRLTSISLSLPWSVSAYSRYSLVKAE